MPTPLKDGIDHINIYSQGDTKLGRFLSNFYEYNQKTPHGIFNSIEGYWYWLASKNHTKDEALKKLRDYSGYKAKKFGRSVRPPDEIYVKNIKSTSFRSNIMKAIWFKIINHSIYFDKFVESTLPFEHYYVYDGNIVEPDHVGWLIDKIEKLRKMMKTHDIKEKEGDLFEVDDDYVLCHCVSSDGKMGAGIAKQFSNKFENIKSSVEDYEVGDAAPYVSSRGRKVYNLVTKEKFYEKPTYKTLEKVLISLKEKLILSGDIKLALPKIGSGLDQLKWEKVKKIIKDNFKNTGIKVLIKYI